MNQFLEMDRRAALTRIMVLVGATTVAGGLAGCKQAAEKGTPMDAAKLALLGAIADTILPATDTPGAVATGVPKQIDGLLVNWASPERRAELNGAIDAIGKLGGDKGFFALDAAKRKEALLAFDKEAVKPNPDPKAKLTGLAALIGGGSTAMNPGYVKLKELVISLYYNSETAMTKELIYEHVPGKFVPSLPVTPETRPFAGVGGLG
jgi:gluconate 2-dehydrogenase gamma chain